MRSLFIPIDHSELNQVEKRTWQIDNIRGSIDGLLANMDQAVYLLVAIQFFALSDAYKSVIAASKFAGLLGTLFIGVLFGGRNLPKARLAGLVTLLSGAALILAAFSPGPELYVLGVSAHLMFYFFRIPLFTAIYEENYRALHRGQLYSTSVLLSTVSGLSASFLFGALLDADLANFRWLAAVLGIMVMISALLLFRIPSQPVARDSGDHPLRDLKLLIENPVFGLVSLSWFMVGFANLWSLPLRSVYLAESERGLGLDPFSVVLVLAILPNAVRIVLNRFWARRFDRINVVLMRILLNMFIAAGMIMFFTARNITGAAVASVVGYIGFSGTQFLWNLWVTKIAPPGQSQRYMSVHSFLAGVRGLAGPWLGFYVAARLSIPQVGIISFALILLGSLILIPAYRLLNKKTETR